MNQGRDTPSCSDTAADVLELTDVTIAESKLSETDQKCARLMAASYASLCPEEIDRFLATTAQDSSIKYNLPESDAFERCFPDGCTDSGYASRGPSQGDEFPSDITGPVLEPEFKVWTVKSLTHHTEQLPQAALDHFDDLFELYGSDLAGCIARKQHIMSRREKRASGTRKNFAPTSCTLRCLSITGSTPRPWLVVCCDEVVHKNVQKFFTDSSRRERFHPLRPSVEEPAFPILLAPPLDAHARAALLRNVFFSKNDRISTLSRPHLKESQQLRGSYLEVETPAGAVKGATFGGVIEVVMPGNKVQQYGMTVGHVTDSYLDPATQHDSDTDDDVLQAWDSSDEESENETSSGTCSKPFQHAMPLPGSPQHNPVRQAPSTNDPNFAGFYTGWVLSPDKGFFANRKCLDWGLIIPYTPYTLQQSLFTPYLPWKPWTGEFSLLKFFRSSVVVKIMSGVSGVRDGLLSFRPSKIMISPGRRFTDAYMLSFSNESALEPGECGSWVLDASFSLVLGHLVASDSFGQAYVIPFDQTMAQIKEYFGAQTVRPAQDPSLLTRQGAALPIPPHPCQGTSAPGRKGSDSGYSSQKSSFKKPSTVRDPSKRLAQRAMQWRRTSSIPTQMNVNISGRSTNSLAVPVPNIQYEDMDAKATRTADSGYASWNTSTQISDISCSEQQLDSDERGSSSFQSMSFDNSGPSFINYGGPWRPPSTVHPDRAYQRFSSNLPANSDLGQRQGVQESVPRQYGSVHGVSTPAVPQSGDEAEPTPKRRKANDHRTMSEIHDHQDNPAS